MHAGMVPAGALAVLLACNGKIRPIAPAAALPLCGVITPQGYGSADAPTFLAPAEPRQSKVARYNLTDATHGVAPLSSYGGWWMCITEGTVTQAPSETYGKIEVRALTIDQTTGERGQE